MPRTTSLIISGISNSLPLLNDESDFHLLFYNINLSCNFEGKNPLCEIFNLKLMNYKFASRGFFPLPDSSLIVKVLFDNFCNFFRKYHLMSDVMIFSVYHLSLCFVAFMPTGGGLLQRGAHMVRC